ncbi:MAG: hypothetical protein CVV33_00070, partial [Methanomicrobiales archaeon HGW-Methanomicrobiales-4]
QAPNLGIPQATPVIPSEIVSPVITGEPTTQVETPIPADTSIISSGPAVPPGSPETRNTQGVVLPSPTTVSWQPDPDNPMPAVQMVEYADIVGKYTGSTAPFRIPTPYWEISYNVTPSGTLPIFMMDIMEKGDAGSEDKTIRSMVFRQGKVPDQKEGRFFEGGRDYYLKITAEQLEKYRIIISIPLKYIPDT